MQQFKRHIATIFLLSFLFPQVAGSIHYYVVAHKFTTQYQYAYIQTNPDLSYHTCLFHLNGLSSILPPGIFPEFLKVPAKMVRPNFWSLENYIHQPDFHFQLRGPPLI